MIHLASQLNHAFTVDIRRREPVIELEFASKSRVPDPIAVHPTLIDLFALGSGIMRWDHGILSFFDAYIGRFRC